MMEPEKKDKSQKLTIITITAGIILILLSILFFYLYIDALMNWDITSNQNPFGFLVLMTIFLMAGLMICLIPNQKRLARWGMRRSMQMYSEALNEMGGMPRASGTTPNRAPAGLRICVKCGRQIPNEKIDRCPYCGHHYGYI
ncbi:MAG: hypothetical protein EU544_03330 [Promethearchaeota archaeon]|nr:MAG: hypothetical protein EU544_03330 [Candidatus Lokiarchaeota archaeon]